MKIAYHAFAVGLLLCLCGTAQSVDLVINPDVSQETVSRNTLRSIFSMRMTRWPDGTPIHVFVMGDKTNLHADFSKQILGVFPHQLRRAWNRQIYSGMGQAPTKVESEAEMREQVEKTPGAIGYLSKENINERVRTISVE
ncbi:MAG: substrate-binding domain-containing protein [Candidatus Thiodiazotropha sp. (ex Dulcina madagascariensis)]|nr:substrate-binding domain-containing protein [Candidatus Thiodiazotropha sp. (ex Dulcina madagascariensis)]MCU7926516.1 substrate-binding domain-containing protein [Candidatus Thiodiazotropha sp. (ex Dulcina madagascariensis)]